MPINVGLLNVKSLGFKLGCVIILKIVFLYALWCVVLQYQKTHVDTPKMAERLLSPPSSH